MVEEWRPVAGWEDKYEVSEYGNIKNIVRNRVLARSKNGDGYFHVIFTRGKKRSTYCNHALVLETFVGPRPDGNVACHIDGSRINNHFTNLYWGTPQQNSNDAHRQKRFPVGSMNHNHKLDETDVVIAIGLYLGGVQNATIARLLGVQPPCVEKIFKGRSWSWLTGICNRKHKHGPYEEAA